MDTRPRRRWGDPLALAGVQNVRKECFFNPLARSNNSLHVAALTRMSGCECFVSQVDDDDPNDRLPLVYDPAVIDNFWGRRPVAVVRRATQLLRITGGFLGRMAWDVFRGRLQETEVCVQAQWSTLGVMQSPMSKGTADAK